jgi:Tir chaperone protein (CesT) family
MSMSGRQQIDEFIQRFGKERDLVLDPLNAQGYTEIARGSALVRINVVEEHGVLLMIAPVMRVPERNTEAFYRRLLELSFLATSDAAFAIDKKTDMAYLRILRRLEGMDYEEFEDLLHTIATVADEWDDKLKAQFGG